MNGTIERPVEEKLESRKSVFTYDTGNIFFSRVLRRYHLMSTKMTNFEKEKNVWIDSKTPKKPLKKL
jgi:hypothetical protein